MSKKPVALIIMDGFGYNASDYGNAITAANTPNLDKYMQGPHTLIGASGLDVGLPDGQMGNSEVGHTNIGAGRIVYQMLVKISKSIQDGDFFENPALKSAMENCKEKNSSLHLMGLLSPGGVHSHMEHLYGLLEMAKKNGIEKVYVHAFLDGRDVPPSSAAEYMQQACDKMKEIGVGSVATVMGRFYAMDRDNAWDRVEKAYNAMVLGEGVEGCCPVQAIKDSYTNGVTDEFMLPTVCDKNGMVEKNDSVIFFNFRPDRARQITRAFVEEGFSGFERKKGFFPLNFVCMAQYDATMPNVSVAFPPEALEMTFGEYVSKMGKTQLRIAETQKYAHVTFFFNGGEEKTFEGEDRILIKSPDVETFDMKPEMSAYEVTDSVVEAINSDKYDAIILIMQIATWLVIPVYLTPLKLLLKQLTNVSAEQLKLFLLRAVQHLLQLTTAMLIKCMKLTVHRLLLIQLILFRLLLWVTTVNSVKAEYWQILHLQCLKSWDWHSLLK